jgi:hypothetical protein
MFLEYFKKILHFPLLKKNLLRNKKFIISKNNIVCVEAFEVYIYIYIYIITYQYKKSNKENLVFLESNNV